VLAAFVLALAGCGDDNSSNAQSSVRTEPLPPASQTQTDGQTQTQPTGKQGGSGDSEAQLQPKIELDNSEPAPAVAPKQRKKAPHEPQSKAQRKAVSKQVYESSKFFCKTAGIEGMRKEYGVASADPEAIAREAARRTYSRGDSGAVYSGCLAGLRESAK
jgi:hypothetical protein